MTIPNNKNENRHTNDVDEVNANPICQLFQLHSLHWEDPAYLQILGEQHPVAHP